MAAQLLSGKNPAFDSENTVHRTVAAYRAKGYRAPALAVVLANREPASHIYVRRKEEMCQKVGILSKKIELPDSVSEDAFLKLISALNEDSAIDGILVQLPLPSPIQKEKIIEHILPHKDVDGFHPYNLGKLAQGHPTLRPCTPYGIMRLLQYYKISPKGLHAVVVGASTIVGRPMALELLLAGATVTICHSQTQHLKNHVAAADILISATGKRNIVQADWIKAGAVVIDVGIHRQQNNTLCGDLDFASIAQKAAFITPVPGGVGLMTIAMLMENTLLAFEYQRKRDDDTLS